MTVWLDFASHTDVNRKQAKTITENDQFDTFIPMASALPTLREGGENF